jgi:hypothetical protein
MWDPQRLTTLWASMACYRDSFTFTLLCTLGIISGLVYSGVLAIYLYISDVFHWCSINISKTTQSLYIWLSHFYTDKCKNYKISILEIVSNLLSFPPSSVLILYSAPCPQTPWLNVMLPLFKIRSTSNFDNFYIVLPESYKSTNIRRELQ